MTEYIKIRFQNIEPLMIADDSNSQSGQVDALTYVPGTALRGAVIGGFIKAGKFDKYKKFLLSDQVAFLNSYIVAGDKEMIPSLKGFSEDKTDIGYSDKNKSGKDKPENDGMEKAVENTLIKEGSTPGYKNASMGDYCYLEGNTIHYVKIDMDSDMKINKGKRDEKQNVFRNQYIAPGYTFTAYIAVSDLNNSDEVKKFYENLKEILEKILRENFAILR